MKSRSPTKNQTLQYTQNGGVPIPKARSSSSCFQNGAIASLGTLPSSSTSSREPTPSISFSPPPLSPNQIQSRLNSPPHHYHLPSYRFVDEDSRPKSALGSATDCQICGLSRRRDKTWLEIEAAYGLRDSENELNRLRNTMEGVAERRRHFEAATRLQEANNELDRLLDELEAFSCSPTKTPTSRSKSTPDFDFFNSPSSQQYDLPPPLPRSRYFYNIRKEELLRRQKADKLALEIEDQRNRRHGYLPNLSPSLQNDIGRLEQLLNEYQDPVGRSTPKLINDGSIRSRSLSSNSLRSPFPSGDLLTRRPSQLTGTSLYKV